MSVLIATYNRADLLGEAIESVRRQTYQDWEIIVSDDASSDNTKEVVEALAAEDLRIRYFRHEKNVGISKNRNSGLAAARGEYLAPLDSDDVWTDPTKLERQVAFLEAHPDHALVGTFVAAIDATGAPAGSIDYETDDARIRAKIYRRNQFTQSSVMMRASAVREAGGYDEGRVINEDYDLWLKIGARHRFANLPERMTGYRIHAGGITKVRRMRAADEHLLIMRKHRGAYPNYALGLAKAYARILMAIAGL